jgi:hypothetical protein
MWPRAAVIVEPSHESPGSWYWTVRVDGETYAEGVEDDEETARAKAQMNLDCWRGQQEEES